MSVHGHVARVAEGTASRAAAASERTGPSGPHVQAVEDPRPGRDDEDAAVSGIGHEEVPGSIERQAQWQAARRPLSSPAAARTRAITRANQ